MSITTTTNLVGTDLTGADLENAKLNGAKNGQCLLPMSIPQPRLLLQG